MDRFEPQTVTALFVLATLVATGPLVGVGAFEPRATTIGDGTASVGGVHVDTTQFRVTDGRFGTAVPYLRVPDASVTVDAVTGRPRLLYQISIPRLDASMTSERVFSTAGTYRLAPGDRALEPSSVGRERYNGTVRITVQSFEATETVYDENVTVAVIE
ncbi:YbeD family protein [Haloarcula salina]|uniref:Uncharacterized protein n=1 Tax=Haloarcula salina TaxID=1429914 RepID=A0AA41KKG2_9EURY|nr:hypothetical protein [Haloarcula salina]MBV0903773.1 hypothetical protein [Haloarcula salina]